MASPIYIVLMGVQGAGKGTQATRLVEKYGIPHVTTGGMFRAMKGLDTPLAREIQDIMNRGDLVPDTLTIQVVRDRLGQPDAARGAIFDGFPRTRPQAEALDAMLKDLGTRVTIVPFFNLDREIAVKRISDRWECTKDPTHVYNMASNPPKVAGICDLDGAAIRQRPDDTPDAAARRIDQFFASTMPLLNYYRDQGVLAEINGNQAIEKVTEDVIAAVDAAIKKNS